jgi:hypothetical protein
MVQQEFAGCAGCKQPCSFRLALAEIEICQTFVGQQQCQDGMACPKSATQSLHDMET